jgi:hypothetical protein
MRRHCEAWNKPWQSLALYVILSATKDLLAGYTLSTVIARLETSRGNLLAVLCHHEHNGLTQLHFYNHNSEICGYRSEGTINFIYKKLASKGNYPYICSTISLYNQAVKMTMLSSHTISLTPILHRGGGFCACKSVSYTNTYIKLLNSQQRRCGAVLFCP